MFLKLWRGNVHAVILLISHTIVFIIGLYMVSDFSIYHKTYRTEMNGDNGSLLRNRTSFLQVGRKYQADKVTIHHYDKMYEKYLRKYVGTNVSILEIGLGCAMYYGPGASAYLWRDYLGPQADIHFIEFNRKCGEVWHQDHGIKLNITMYYGSQEDVVFLNSIAHQRGYFDVIIDDGGHTIKQQITSITHLVSKVRSGGIYVIEDLQTSYARGRNTGYLVNGTTIEFIKQLIDDLQTNSPSRKSAILAQRISSFEISNEICFFNVI